MSLKTRPAVIGALAALALAPAAGAQPPDFGRLHADLKLTPAQDAAWRSFVVASQPDPEETARDRNARAMMPSLTAPQRVQLSIDAMRADLESLERRGEAIKAFYAALTPDQQATFDRETRPTEEQDEP